MIFADRPKIRAVAFDLWETLITDTPELSRQQERLRIERLAAVFEDAGVPLEYEQLAKAHRALWHQCQARYWSNDRDIACRVQVEHLLEALQIEQSAMGGPVLEKLEEAYAHAAVEIPPEPLPGALEMLGQLKERGLALGLVSNTGRTPGSALRRVLDRLGMGRFLDTLVFSNEHGFCKPERSIFEELRRGLGMTFEEIAFIGDNEYADVHGAQQCGMIAIHFDPPVRGTAVAAHVAHGLQIEPHARIRSLTELPPLIAELSGIGS